MIDRREHGNQVAGELAAVTAQLATSAASGGNVALAYHYLALAQVATATVPCRNPHFPRQDGAKGALGTFRPAEPPGPHAAGLAWPAVWLAADRRYDEAIQFCDRILDRGQGTAAELLRVRRFRLDLRMTHEGLRFDMGHAYSRICAEEDGQPFGGRAVDADDLAYTIYLGRLLHPMHVRGELWKDGIPPEAVSVRLRYISSAREYVPLYWRRRLPRLPVLPGSSPAGTGPQVRGVRRPARGRARLRRLDAQLRRHYADLSSVASQANPRLSRDDVAVLAGNDPGWAAAAGLLTEIKDDRAWTQVREGGIDWTALLDQYYWDNYRLGVIKFMASLHAEAPPYPICLYRVLLNGRSDRPRDRRTFDLQIQAMRGCRAAAPRTAPEPTPAARARGTLPGKKGNDRSCNAGLYVLAVVDHDRWWNHVDGMSIRWHDCRRSRYPPLMRG
jgi:hypothetical protein